VLRLARESFGPDIDIIVHCHNDWTCPARSRWRRRLSHINPLYFEDPLAPLYSDSWLALRHTTRIPILTGEDIELLEAPFPSSRIRPWIASNPT